MAQHKLTDRQVRAKPAGKHGDGGGLYLHKRKGGSAQWYFRFMIHGMRHEMGMGGYPDVSLAKAREFAAHWRGVVAAGKNPIKVRDKERCEAEREIHTVESVTHAAFEARKASLKGDGKNGQWMSPVNLYVIPKLGRMPIEELDQNDIVRAFQTIWHVKYESAKKAINRLGIVLEHGAAMGLNVDAGATAKAKALLGQSRYTKKITPVMPWQEVPAFYATLETPTITHLALRLLILTGHRSKPIRFARYDQIDGDIWTVPSENLKSLKNKMPPPFRTPLSTEAKRIIELARPFERDGYLFPSMRRGVISDGTMGKKMKDRGIAYRPHGFRKSLRNWAGENGIQHEVGETLLQHAVGNAVSRAYLTTDFLEQRIPVMQRWANHVTGLGSADVVSLVQNDG